MVNHTRRLFRQSPLRPYVEEETYPGPAFQSREEIIALCRRAGLPGAHFSGTCKMGRDPLAVVDEKLRVRGVSGLRVVDASVMPTLVSGNINGPVMAIAWRAADLILADALQSTVSEPAVAGDTSAPPSDQRAPLASARNVPTS
jgi:choline dehydrogenase